MKKNKGFTLIELVIYVGLSVIMFFIIGIFITGVLQSERRNKAIREVEEQGSRIVQIISQSLRNSNQIISPTTNSLSSNLSLHFNDINQDVIDFNLVGTDLEMVVANNLSSILNNNLVKVTAINFINVSRNNTPGAIAFNFTLEYVNQSGFPEANYRAIFYGSGCLR